MFAKFVRNVRCFIWLNRVSGQPIRTFKHVFLGHSWWSRPF